MPTNKEVFQSWEQAGSRTTVHILQIDRGDGSAANRLTLTDKFYLDKGVSGAKYYDTYPAPIHCIISDLETTESMDKTSIAPIVLANGNGKFNSLSSEENIIGHRFTVLRGDTSWSLLEDSYPYKFVEVFKGQIQSISVGRDKVTLRAVPVKYSLDNTIGSTDAPIHYGSCRNVPGLLVDSGSDAYRFTTLETMDSATGSQTEFRVRDNGVQLTLTTDFTLTLESGLFKSKIALVGGPPDGKLTADLESHLTLERGNPLFHTVRKLIQDQLADSVPAQVQVKSASAFAQFTLANEDAKIYGCSNFSAWEYTLSTPGNISTASVIAIESITVGSGNAKAIRVNASGTVLRYARGASIDQYDLSPAWAVTGMTIDVSFDPTTVLGGSDNLRDIEIPPAEDTLYILHKDGIIYKLDITAGDISTATNSAVVLRLRLYNSTATYNTMFFSPDGTKLYVMSGDSNVLTQFECLEAWVILGAIPARREFYPAQLRAGSHTYEMDCVKLSYDGTKIITQIDPAVGFEEWGAISGHNLPPELIGSRVSSDHKSYPAGAFYNSEVQVGRVLNDLLSSIAATFTIDRLGILIAVRLEDPNDALDASVNVHDLYLGDFIGERSTHIGHKSTESAKKLVTIRYDKNFAVQGESEFAGAVTDDNKAYYSGPYEITTYGNTLTNYIDPEDFLVDTFLGNTTANAQSVVNYVAGIWDQDREIYELSLNLKCITQLSDFGIGSIVRLNGDVRNPNFSDGDRVLVTGRRVNWSKNKQSLTVFK